MTKDGRSRNWAFIVYPQSAPDNWRDILDDLHIEWVESPLHDQDINPGTNEKKKAHWHILLLFSGSKSYDQILQITASINATIPIVCQSVSGMIRYMAHLDNPEKAQYCLSDIKAHGGADLQSYLKPTSAERYRYIREMQAYIRENNIIEYCDFLDFAAAEHPDDWFPLLCDSCSYVIGSYIKSRRHSGNRMGKYKQLVDPETGEAIFITI